MNNDNQSSEYTMGQKMADILKASASNGANIYNIFKKSGLCVDEMTVDDFKTKLERPIIKQIYRPILGDDVERIEDEQLTFEYHTRELANMFQFIAEVTYRAQHEEEHECKCGKGDECCGKCKEENELPHEETDGECEDCKF